MKKRAYGYSRWRWRLGGYMLLGLAFVIVALVKLQDSVTQEEVHPPQIRNTVRPKLAFLFLARNVMPLDILWEHFFEGSRDREFSIYLHARPGYSYTKENTKCSFFIDRQLKNSIQVEWGEASMIQAERLLLMEALKDPLNERFFLLSDSCIPLYNFDYVYNYVMTSQKSFVDSFVDYSDEQYNIKMESVIPHDYWRKGSQWFVLTRKHAEVVVADSTVFPVFVKDCKKVILPDNWDDDPRNNGTKKPHNCIPDEHYIQTLFAMEDLEEETERRTLTYSRWENRAKGKGREGWHPVTYAFSDATLEAIKNIQDLRSIRYETESRTEWCKAAGEARPCFLFARKFTRAAGFRLLDQVSRIKGSAVHIQPSAVKSTSEITGTLQDSCMADKVPHDLMWRMLHLTLASLTELVDLSIVSGFKAAWLNDFEGDADNTQCIRKGSCSSHSQLGR